MLPSDWRRSISCVPHHQSPRGALCNQLFLVFQAVNCKGQHSISYTLSRNHTVVVEYSHDNDTDMFQVTVLASAARRFQKRAPRPGPCAE